MFFSDSELSLELLGIFKIKRERSEGKTQNTRSYDSISIRTRGSAYFKTDKEKIKVSPGDILYIPKNECYSQYTDGETILAVHFVNYSFKKDNKIELMKIDDKEYIENLLLQMYEIWKEQGLGYRYRCVSLLYSLLYYLNKESREKSYNGSINKRLQIAVNYVHANYRTENICISHLSKMCAVSQTYFRRMFKETYGVSPSEYIINLRLEYATHLLQSKLYTISEVGEKCGFNDSKYFSRLFKKHYKLSPSDYKNINPEKAWK